MSLNEMNRHEGPFAKYALVVIHLLRRYAMDDVIGKAHEDVQNLNKAH